MYCDRRGNGQKPIRTKPPGQKPPRTIEIEFVPGTFVRDFCTRTTKNWGGSEMCDVLSGGVPGCVTKCDRGEGSKLAKNSVTYFMDGPLPSILFLHNRSFTINCRKIIFQTIVHNHRNFQLHMTNYC